MSSSTDNLVYKSILDEVIELAKDDFKNEGVSESVLLELKMIWENKLKTAGVLTQSSTQTSKGKKRKVSQTDGLEQTDGLDDEELGSEDDEKNERTAPVTNDFVLALHEKVEKSKADKKNKWKLKLKGGFLHYEGKDYLFSEAKGEFEW
jgi:hypothetical protein